MNKTVSDHQSTEMKFLEQLEAACFSPTEYDLKFALADMSAGQLSSFRGNLLGPYCKYAKTLPVTFSELECLCSADISQMSQQLISDPCYWTPQLPYLYHWKSEVTLLDGSVQPFEHAIGFKRWEIHQQNFLLERRRTVLRGMVVAQESEIDLIAAHNAEIVLIVSDPSESFLQQASELGVMIIADMREVRTPITSKLLHYTWQPAVALVLLDEKNSGVFYKPHTLTLCQTIPANGNPTADVIQDWAEVIVVEMDSADSLPAWLENVEIPVVAVRKDTNNTEPQLVRSACDKLQADLAPEFDLAGYFVSS